eukprot:5749005-Karenia_brevis.AAC.1
MGLGLQEGVGATHPQAHTSGDREELLVQNRMQLERPKEEAIQHHKLQNEARQKDIEYLNRAEGERRGTSEHRACSATQRGRTGDSIYSGECQCTEPHCLPPQPQPPHLFPSDTAGQEA